ncbi:UbiA family prenyltransferase [Streptomyces sp. HNM0663]|uniref:UbiA family prenyltransferase n=1 Tax=Streptomyces chengmaiensis TaxID=3040919 RepID=A0ABT6I050_9ACTN|nr:UbiA family prenyltransferase [Streptomyces chengmaiensis]MDH2393499.1 UbiA family prenyltransferase [Streptomyces chengmaiensis]
MRRPGQADDGPPRPVPPAGPRPGGRNDAAPRRSTGARLPARARLRAWAELLRLPAVFTVPGDALAGAAAAGLRPGRGTVHAIGTSLCLYEAGMALNDWADRDEDALDRPHRPLPSGRIPPAAALTAAVALTAAGLLCAARAGRRPLTVAAALTATVWSYDLHLKHTPAAPAAMAAARALDLLLGATATASAQPGGSLGAQTDQPTDHTPDAPGVRAAPGAQAALGAALTLAAHTYAVTAVSRHEAHGGSTAVPLAALAAAAGTAAHLARDPLPGVLPGVPTSALAGLYLRTAGTPLLHAALNPSPQLTRRAVAGGIRAMIPLQAALTARAGARLSGAALMGLAPLARRLARKVSPT